MQRTGRRAVKARAAKRKTGGRNRADRSARKAATPKARTRPRRLGPGEYLPDPTEGVTRPEDLPAPVIVNRSRDFGKRPCPTCGHKAYRDGRRKRRLHDLGEMTTGRPREVILTFSQHHCSRCDRYFYAETSDIASSNAQYTTRVIAMAVRLVAEDGLPYRAASWHMWRDHRVFVPFATIQNWAEASGGKSGRARCG
jgi:hypothetical protein